jgi:chloride intracellular channel protein 2
LVNVVF